MGAERPKIWAGSKNEPMLEMKIIHLTTKFNFAAIGIYHTFTLEKDTGPQLCFFPKSGPKRFCDSQNSIGNSTGIGIGEQNLHRNWTNVLKFQISLSKTVSAHV